MHEPKGWVHCDLKKKKIKGQVHYQRTSALNFVICTSTNHISHNLIHTRHQRNSNGMYLIWNISKFIRSPVQFDHPRPKWIMLTLHWYARVTCYCYNMTQWCSHALSDINEWFGTGLFRFLNSCHWLLLLKHIYERMNWNHYTIFILRWTMSYDLRQQVEELSQF